MTSHASLRFMVSLRVPQPVCHKKKPVKIRFLTMRELGRRGGLATGEYQI